MRIRGVEWVSLLDYPGEICTTVFYGGCNFRCAFCHNALLVCEPTTFSSVDPVILMKKLRERQKFVPAVCISGGEPTLAPKLPHFVRQLKEHGFIVKLDTNGTKPDVLSRLLADGLLDYVAMDVKAPWHKYSLVTCVPVDTEAVRGSINLLRKMAPAYEFRTTVVPGLLDEADLLNLGQELEGVQKYVLQQFRPTKPLLDPKLEHQQPYAEELLHQVAKKLRPYVKTVEVRC